MGVREMPCLVLALIFFVCASISCAQDYPGGEIYGGVSLANSRYFVRQTSPGCGLSFSLNPHERVRLVADFAGQYQHSSQIIFNGKNATFRDYQFLFGPQFTFRTQRATPFFHALLGVGARHVTTPSGDPQHPQDVLAVDYGFASGFGGGLDLNIHNRIAVRIIQADYVLTHLTPDLPQLSPVRTQLPPATDWQHHFRIGAGLVIKIGTRTAGSKR